MSDELQIVLEDVKEKLDPVIEAFNMVKGRLDHHQVAEEERFQRLENEVLAVRADVSILKTDVAKIRRDLNEHHDNTGLHGSVCSSLSCLFQPF